jgi:hypothetical protein
MPRTILTPFVERHPLGSCEEPVEGCAGTCTRHVRGELPEEVGTAYGARGQTRCISRSLDGRRD